MLSDSILAIPDTNTARQNHGSVPDFGSDYVQQGGRVVVDYDDLRASVDPFTCIIVDSGTLYRCEVDSRKDDDTLSLTDNAVNDVYYQVTTGTTPLAGSLIATTGSEPAPPSLKIAEIDTSGETVTDVSRTRTENFGAVNAENLGFDTPIAAFDAGGKLDSFESITAAINDGKREIWVLDDIEENNIPIPTGISLEDGLTIRGYQRPTITDPDQDGTPMINCDTSADTFQVTLDNLVLKGGNGTGAAIAGNYGADGSTLHRAQIHRCYFLNTGPVVLFGTDELHLKNIHVKSTNEITDTFQGTTYTGGDPLIASGSDIVILGGQFDQSADGTYAGRIVDSKSLWIGGGTKFHHRNTNSDANAALELDGVRYAFLSALDFTNPAANSPRDIDTEKRWSGSDSLFVSIHNNQLAQEYLKFTGVVNGSVKNTNVSTLEYSGSGSVHAESTKPLSVVGNQPENVCVVAGKTDKVGANNGYFELLQNGFIAQDTGTSTAPALQIGENGAGFFVDGSGELVAVDEAGNTTIIS